MTNSVNQTMNTAREAFENACKLFDIAKKNAAQSAVNEILSTGKYMTIKDVQSYTGLTRSEVEHYMGEYVSEWWDKEKNHPLTMTKQQICRTYALLNDDGSVDTTKTMKQSFKAWAYEPKK